MDDFIPIARDIMTASFQLQRRRVKEPQKLTLIDRLLWTPAPDAWAEELSSGTQMEMFHPCAHCLTGVSAGVDQFCNHCDRWLTWLAVPRAFWMGERFPRLRGITFRLLWAVNYAVKEARRDMPLITEQILFGTTRFLAANMDLQRTMRDIRR